jgi:hypothetical protein
LPSAAVFRIRRRSSTHSFETLTRRVVRNLKAARGALAEREALVAPVER